MTAPAVLRQRAVKDLNEIYHWYEAEHEGLGAEFLAEFKQCALTIQEFPQSFSRLNDRVRRANLNRFPYLVFFQVESKRVVVLAIIHQARGPHSWPSPPKRTR